MQKENNHICPPEHAGGLDNRFRKLAQNPKRLLKPYVKPGMTVMDLGCGPGFFTRGMAELLKGEGKIIAVDLQQAMLDKLYKKIKGTEKENLITIHKCNETAVSYNGHVDFVLAFYMVHELKQKEACFKELKTILKPGGKLWIVEPKFHVSKKAFNSMKEKLAVHGFHISGSPKVLFSRSVLLENTPTQI